MDGTVNAVWLQSMLRNVNIMLMPWGFDGTFLEEICTYMREGGFCSEGMSEPEIETELGRRCRNGQTLRALIERADNEGDEAIKLVVRRYIWVLLDGYPSRDG